MKTKFNPLRAINSKILKGLLFFTALVGTASMKAQCSTTLTPTGTLICSGSSATLSSGSASSYTWTGGSNSSSIVVSPTITTTYTLATTNATGCVSSSSVTLVVNDTPTVNAVVTATSVCAGKTVTMTATGANTYVWTNGVTNGASYVPTGTANYTVTGTNACGTSSAVVSVTVFALPSVSATASSPSVCAGGSVTLNGGGAISYTWTPSVSNNTAFAPASTANYTVTGADANGCSATASVNVAVFAYPTAISATSTLICSGASATITSDPSAATYSWNTNATTSVIVVSPTITTVYSVLATNAQGCAVTKTISIVVNNTPTVTAVVTSTSVCYGQTVTMTASGANTYTWNNGVTNGVSYLPFSTSLYTVTGTNACGTATAALSVTVFALPSVSATATSPSICAGGSITLNGTGALSYTWNPVIVNNASFTPVATTVYTVSGSDANGCISSKTINVVVVNVPTVTAVLSNTAVCAGQSVTMTANGATTYTWTNGIANGGSYVPTGTAAYTVTGANACGTASTVVSVTVFALPSVSATASTPSVCAGSSVTLNGAGANSYTWTSGVSNNTAFAPASTSNYTVTGTDGNGCTSTASINVAVFAYPTAISATSTLICSGASATITSDASATTYSWSTNATTSVIVVSPTINTVYSVLATNAQGCAVTRTIGITVNNTPTVTAVVSSTAVCAGKTVTMTASGANTYTWTNSVTNGASYVPTVTRDYTVTGTNACGTSSTVASVTVFALPSVTATASSPSICAGSTVSLNGAGALTYTWTPNIGNNTPFSPTITATYTVSGTDGNGCISVNSTTNITVVNVPTVNAVVSSSAVCSGKTVTMTATGAVSYTWTNGVTNGASYVPTATSDYSVTGVNACGTSSAVVSVTVLALPSVSASASSPSVCSGNTVILNGGGSPSYTWNPTVANNTTFTPSSTTNYSVTGIAVNGCTAQAVVGVTVVNTPSISPIASSNAICVGSTATISAVGAAGYTWTAQNFAGSNSSSITVSPTVTTTYTVQRANSTCTTSAVINLVVNNLPTITVTSPPATVCACSGSAVISATGGVSYTWLPNNAALQSLTVYPCASTNYTVVGSNGFCTSTATVAISVNAIPSISITAASASICMGSTLGLTASGAQSYTWSSAPNASVFPNTASITDTPTMNTFYTASGTSSAGCVGSSLLAITVNTVPATMVTVDPAVLCANGTATISASGADTYSWTLGGSSAPTVTANPIATTNYTLTGYSVNGCANSIVVTVPVSTLALSVAGNTAICQGKQTSLTGSGGTSLVWVGQSPFPMINVSPGVTTVYTLTGIDANNCSLTKTVTLVVNPNPTVTASASPSLICKGETVTLTANGAASYTWGAGAGSATTATVALTPNSPFTYNYDVNAVNSFGCTGSATVSLVVDACTGINEMNRSNAVLNIYPNPNNGNFTISANEGTTLSIVNGLGQVVKTLTVNASNEVSVEGLAKGVYFVIGESNGSNINKKIVVE